MTLGEAKDVVRDNLGRGDIPPAQMNFIMGAARRMIEKRENHYWMVGDADGLGFNLSSGDPDYTISASPISLTDFKDIEALFFKATTETVWTPLESREGKEMNLQYATDDEGPPEFYSEELGILTIYPTPDAIYNMLLRYWKWTSNPSADTSTDELLTRWPEVLIWAASSYGLKVLNKSPEMATPFDALYEDEMQKLHRYNTERPTDSNLIIQPKRGPYSMRGGWR